MTDRLIIRRDLTLAVAREGARAALEHASSLGFAVGVCLCDSAALLLLAERQDGAQPAALVFAEAKAHTAAAIGFPTSYWSEHSQPGGDSWGLPLVAGGRFVALPGGLPVEVDGAVVGSIACAGGPADVDLACAAAGLERIEQLVTR